MVEAITTVSVEANLAYVGSHEIHVTTDPETTDPNHFRRACGKIGVKAHFIYNEFPDGSTQTDYLTGSQCYGDRNAAFADLGRISTGLTESGLAVVREKIEVSPQHPEAQRATTQVEPGHYFESHFVLPDLPTIHGWRMLDWEGTPLLISSTDNKRAQGLLFATLRHYSTTAAEFCQRIDALYSALSEQIAVTRPTVEYALYDTNTKHDAAWVDAYMTHAQAQ
jgi:hypothetical protein